MRSRPNEAHSSSLDLLAPHPSSMSTTTARLLADIAMCYQQHEYAANEQRPPELGTLRPPEEAVRTMRSVTRAVPRDG